MSTSDKKPSLSPDSPTTDSPGQTLQTAQFPIAQVREARATSALLLTSEMWWATAICLLLAFWLTWRAIPASGPSIVILFPDGHGLKSGDAVRHRGIDVGTVSEVVLSEDLSQISATVTFTPEAAKLAREGTRFWIVRPQLSLTGVSGLETAVGAKYIAVSPGDPNGALRKSFDGLAIAPPDEQNGKGIDVVLRSDGRHGVTVGSPITWRGIDVGQTLAIHLSPDARFVDVHAQIQPEYSRLLQKNSRFWVTSGLGVDVGLSGLHLNADSLSSIVRGGI
jgi:paraquat-inducible protein B